MHFLFRLWNFIYSHEIRFHDDGSDRLKAEEKFEEKKNGDFSNVSICVISDSETKIWEPFQVGKRSKGFNGIFRIFSCRFSR